MKICFLGSGPIAVPILEQLYRSDRVELLECGTQQDRPAGRRRQLQSTPLGSAADRLGIPCRRWADVNAPEALDRYRALQPDCIVVASFGQLLRQELLTLPAFGCLNVHASLLPRYRGASPIAQAILNGDDVSGVCFMAMEKGLDTGAVYARHVLPLNGTEYADSLEETLGRLAAGHVEEVLLSLPGAKPVPQNPALATVCRKIGKADGFLDPGMSAAGLDRRIRAFRPWPGGTLMLYNETKSISLTVTGCLPADAVLPPGRVQGDRGRLFLGAADGTLELLSVIPAGKREMTAREFLNGFRQPCRWGSPVGKMESTDKDLRK